MLTARNRMLVYYTYLEKNGEIEGSGKATHDVRERMHNVLFCRRMGQDRPNIRQVGANAQNEHLGGGNVMSKVE